MFLIPKIWKRSIELELSPLQFAFVRISHDPSLSLFSVLIWSMETLLFHHNKPIINYSPYPIFYHICLLIRTLTYRPFYIVLGIHTLLSISFLSNEENYYNIFALVSINHRLKFFMPLLPCQDKIASHTCVVSLQEKIDVQLFSLSVGKLDNSCLQSCSI